MSQQGCVIEASGVFKRFSRSDGRIVLKDILHMQGWFSLAVWRICCSCSHLARRSVACWFKALTFVQFSFVVLLATLCRAGCVRFYKARPSNVDVFVCLIQEFNSLHSYCFFQLIPKSFSRFVIWDLSLNLRLARSASWSLSAHTHAVVTWCYCVLVSCFVESTKRVCAESSPHVLMLVISFTRLMLFRVFHKMSTDLLSTDSSFNCFPRITWFYCCCCSVTFMNTRAWNCDFHKLSSIFTEL